MLLGCIGDDFTGTSDLANTLSQAGMQVTQYCGVPQSPARDDVEAGAVAIKSRSTPVRDAVSQALATADWLVDQGCRQFFFKYCSTFDSTRDGNIGPVIDALMNRLGVPGTIVCPAYPANERTVYQGHLFVGDRLLNESGMEHHPLTPMTDPDIRRWLGHQTRQRVGHVRSTTVAAGEEAGRQAFDREVEKGRALVVVDAVDDKDLLTIGRAFAHLKLLTGGAGIATGLPANFRKAGHLSGTTPVWHGGSGSAAILSGSCSPATRAQVTHHERSHGSFAVEIDSLMSGDIRPGDVVAQAMARGPVPLIFSSAEPETVKRAQDRYGRERLAESVEAFFADTARCLVERGVSRLIVAGGETSGAVVEGLNLTELEIGPEIAPGVPALKAGDRPLWLTLKSGNFGGPDFFERALATLQGDQA